MTKSRRNGECETSTKCGKQWIAKRFNNAAWEREIRAYTDAGRLSISAIKQGLAIARQYDEVIRNPDRNAGKVRLIDQAYGSIGVLSEAQAIWKL